MYGALAIYCFCFLVLVFINPSIDQQIYMQVIDSCVHDITILGGNMLENHRIPMTQDPT